MSWGSQDREEFLGAVWGTACGMPVCPPWLHCMGPFPAPGTFPKGDTHLWLVCTFLLDKPGICLALDLSLAS